MRILQVNKLYAPHIGGIETVVQTIAEGLNARASGTQINMRVLVCQPKGRASLEVYNGVNLTRAKSHGIVFSMPVSSNFFNRFRQMVKDADVLQLHTPFPLADIALWLFRPTCKVVVWWHSDIIKQKFFRLLLAPFIHFTLRRANLIITATEGHIKSSLYLNKYREKCKIIPYGLDFNQYPPQYEPFLSNKLLDKKNAKLLFVGRLVYYKGIDVLLKAMESVSGAELFVAGNGEIKPQENVHVLGGLSRADLLKAYADCDVFVFPSVANSEAFGLVQLEAMYYGKPVVNTSLPTGVPYVSVGGETGLTVPPGDSGKLADAINELVNNPGLRKQFGENASKRVRDEFDVNKMLDKLMELYSQ